MMVPVFNSEPYLHEFLASVEQQDIDDFEIIIVNDGSTDGSARIIESWTHCIRESKPGWNIIFRSQKNLGPAMAVGNAFSHVTGEYLMWADSDDILMPGSVSVRASYLDSHPETGMVYVQAAFMHTADKAFPGIPEGDYDILEGLFRGETTCAAGCYMVRTALLLEAYPDRKIPDSVIGQNLQLLIPAASRTQCHVLGCLGMLYRIHPGSRSVQPKSFNTHMARINALEKLLISLISHCICDGPKYEIIVRETVQKEKQRLLEQTREAIRKERI
jgi:glycosyltransferase involved in cell wall biosynthesis